MAERMLILLAVAGLTVLLLVAGRAFVAARRQRALVAVPYISDGAASEAGRVRLLAFSTLQCQQCRLLQKPALEEVAAQDASVEIVSVDALSSPELAARYQIFTVPSTVVLAPDGRAAAVNYGYAPAQQLLEQIKAADRALAAR